MLLLCLQNDFCPSVIRLSFDIMSVFPLSLSFFRYLVRWLNEFTCTKELFAKRFSFNASGIHIEYYIFCTKSNGANTHIIHYRMHTYIHWLTYVCAFIEKKRAVLSCTIAMKIHTQFSHCHMDRQFTLKTIRLTWNVQHHKRYKVSEQKRIIAPWTMNPLLPKKERRDFLPSMKSREKTCVQKTDIKFSNFTKSSSSESLEQINFEKRFQAGKFVRLSL